jgi:hypothetical protein
MTSTRWWAIAMLAAAPLAAQGPDRPMGPGAGPMAGMMMGDPMSMQGVMAPLMRAMVYTPEHLLARKDALGLTADQVARLTKLRDATRAARDAAMATAKTHAEELAQAAEAPKPDTAALKTHFQAAQAKAVLTDAQRAKVKAWADSMQVWMQQHRQMMRPGRSN